MNAQRKMATRRGRKCSENFRQVIKCMSHDQHLKGEDISQNTLKPFK